MNYNQLYSKQENYFGDEPSDGLVKMLENYDVNIGKALDIGAGEGRNSIYLAKYGFEVTSIEPSQDGANKIIDKANRLGLSINVLNCDYLRENSSELYDFIIAGTSLDNMEKDYLDKAIEKIKNSLAVGGFVYIVSFTEDDPGFLRKKDDVSECSDFVKHYFAKGELKNYFKDLNILYYDEYFKPDNSHGEPHVHGKVKLIARKI